MSTPISNALGNAARTAYDLAYQVSPIIFSGGLFSQTLGGLMPIMQLVSGVLADVTGDSSLTPQVRYVPLPGSTAISNQIATYPFANVNVAANAVIRNPKQVSLLMIAPVNSIGGYLMKQAIFTALQNTFDQHNQQGGTYHIMTPSFLFTDCVMAGMEDVTQGDGTQQQIEWRLDFLQPLVTQQQATQAFNGLMGQIAGGQQITSAAWSGPGVAVGSPIQGGTAPLFGIFPTS